MFIQIGYKQYLDLFPIIFMLLAQMGLALAIIAILLGREAKNSYKTLARVLAFATMFLFCGTIVLGIIGCDPYVGTYRGDVHFYRNPCAWVSFGLGIGAFICGLAAFLVQFFTKDIVEEEEKNIKEFAIEEDKSECLFYQEFSQGAIEVKEGYITFYHNLLNFTKFKKGRVSTLIFINDIQHISYKGAGWFSGVLVFMFKHSNKPLGIKFSKWGVGRSKKLNKKMTPIYEYIKMQVINNNK